MNRTAQLLIFPTLTVVLLSSSVLADSSAKEGAKRVIYNAVVEDYQGFPSVSYKEPFEVRFFANPQKEKKFKLNSDGGAQWLYRPLGECAGHILVPEFKDSTSWAAGTKGSFDIMCPNSFIAQGELTAIEDPKDEGFLGVWEGSADDFTPPPPTTEQNAPESANVTKMKLPKLKFILKVKK